MDSFIGFVVVATGFLIVWLVSKTNALASRVTELESESRVATRRLNELWRAYSGYGDSGLQKTAVHAPIRARPVGNDVPGSVAELEPAPVLNEPAPIVNQPELQFSPDPVEDNPHVHSAGATKPSRAEEWLVRARTSGEWEALIGGNWLNRIGALALMFGVAFFLKYAFDNNWIKQGGQVGIGITVGAVLLAVARRTHAQGYAIFAQGLVGAGLAVLYLSVYASYGFYSLIPLPAAFVALAAVVALAFYQSLFYDSLVVALLAWGGGFLTPFLLSSSGGGPVGVTAYVFLLDVGILAVVLRKDAWAVLEGLSLGASYTVYLSWFATSYSSRHLGTGAIALTMFWALFYAFDVWKISTATTTFAAFREYVASANALAYFGCMFALLYPLHRLEMGLVSLSMALMYICTIVAIRHTVREGDRAATHFTLTSLVLLIVATALVGSGFGTVIAWSLEAVGILWIGIRLQVRYVWQPALVLYGLAAVVLPTVDNALVYEPAQRFMPLLNWRCVAFLTLAAALAVGTRPVAGLRDKRRQSITALLHYGWCSVAFTLLTVETNDVFRRGMTSAVDNVLTELGYIRFLAIAGVWMVLSLTLVWLGLRRNILPVLVSGLCSAVLSVGLGCAAGVTYWPMQRFLPILNVRAGVLSLLIIGLVAQLRWLADKATDGAWIGAVRVAFQAAIVLVGFELLTAEINDMFARAAGGRAQTNLDSGLFVEVSILGVVWMMYSLLLVWKGVQRQSQWLVTVGLGSTGLAVAAGAYCGFAVQPTARLQLVLVSRAVLIPILIAGLFAQTHLLKSARRRYSWVDAVLIACQAAIVFFGFELISGQTRDVFDRLASTSTDANNLRNLEQLVLSALWLVYGIGLMIVGLWRRMRWMRFGSICLFGFVVLKVFIYDLSFLQGLYRSASFVALGFILLAVSYVYSRYHAVLLEA